MSGKLEKNKKVKQGNLYFTLGALMDIKEFNIKENHRLKNIH